MNDYFFISFFSKRSDAIALMKDIRQNNDRRTNEYVFETKFIKGFNLSSNINAMNVQEKIIDK